MLVHHGADDRNGGRFTMALLSAARQEREMWCQQILKQGADVNAQDELGYTALEVACKRGGEGLVQLLLRAGADAKSVCKAPHHGPLCEASREGNTVIVKALLDHGADASARCYHYGPALKATRFDSNSQMYVNHIIPGSEAMAQLLLEAGAVDDAVTEEEMANASLLGGMG